MVPMSPRLMRPIRQGPRRPGAPTIIVAVADSAIEWIPPVSDGGSPLIAYRLYVNGVLEQANYGPDNLASVDVATAGQVVEVSAVNAVGEGPRSAPVIVSP